MKKTLIKISVFVLTFIVSLIVIGMIMNRDHDNLTMDMAPASLPVITMEKEGVAYNRLQGYTRTMDIAFQRDTITVLGSNRDTDFVIDTYGREVTGISVEVRSTDGQRLIEDTVLTDYQVEDWQITGRITLKDLLEKDTTYALTILLTLEDGQEVRYYSRIIWSENLYAMEKLNFVTDFHDKLYDKEAARDLIGYLETNSQLEDNSSFHKVNINSSFNQITWGDLPVREELEPSIQLTEIASQTASFLLHYMVSTQENNHTTYYQVQEHYRVRYTMDRIFLLAYERTMTQMPDVDEMYANDKILLGITAEDIPMVESEDGNVVVFEVANQLYSYNVTTNRLAVIFSFNEQGQFDTRTLLNQHGIKIMDVDEGGNVKFAVYGYMNRGRHEGEVGIQINFYDSSLNTTEELVYIPYTKTYSVLEEEVEQLLYMNRSERLYLFLENTVYGIDLVERTYEHVVDISQDDSLQVSSNHKIIVWQEGSDIYHCNKLQVCNLNTNVEYSISAASGEAIRPLGFMGEDVIYGVAREADIVEESSGQVFFPMYKVCISSAGGEVLKEYRQNNVYITSCSIVNNQITLERMTRQENNVYTEIEDDQIMNNNEVSTGKNVLVTADIDVYKRYVQIQTRNNIDSKTIQIQTPKEIVFEGGRGLVLEGESAIPRYYVYGPYGIDGIYSAPAKAIDLAYEIAGVVVNDNGECVWLRGNRVTRNQIMAITAQSITEQKDSLAVCLDTILEFEGIIRNSEYLLAQGKTAMEILEENLEDTQILDLTGCSLDAVLYYVNQDIPVLAVLDSGEAVLVTGFNESNVVIMDPTDGTLEKRGMSDTAAWFTENGNNFITYMRSGS